MSCTSLKATKQSGICEEIFARHGTEYPGRYRRHSVCQTAYSMEWESGERRTVVPTPSFILSSFFLDLICNGGPYFSVITRLIAYMTDCIWLWL